MARSFWAIELHPGKEYTSTLDFDLHVTQAVLTGAAKDKSERSIVSVKIAEEEGEAKTFSIASLKLDHADSQGLDLVFDADDEIVFSVTGKNVVHLSGYLIPPTGDDEDEFGEFGSDEEIPSDEEGMLSQDEDSDEEEVDEEAIKAQIAAAKRKQSAGQQQNGAPAAKKAKQEAQPQAQAQKPKAQQQTPNKPAEQKKPQQQQQQKSPAQQQKAAAPRKLQGGVEATVMREGTGKTAQRGNRVSVKYVGRLTKNNKVFDKSLDRPFNFILGKREVITGWEVGVDGMKEGEKRKLVIPPALAYGASGAPPDIPPNSSLTFEVELVKIAGK